jgi:hypothetical protein
VRIPLLQIGATATRTGSPYRPEPSQHRETLLRRRLRSTGPAPAGRFGCVVVDDEPKLPAILAANALWSGLDYLLASLTEIRGPAGRVEMEPQHEAASQPGVGRARLDIEALYLEHQDAMWGKALRMLDGDQHRAADAVQATILTIMSNPPTDTRRP